MRRHHHRIRDYFANNTISAFWNAFWYPPDVVCPKCKTNNIEYYDPFFFSPIRTLRFRRRVKCKTCRFIWRPKKT